MSGRPPVDRGIVASTSGGYAGAGRFSSLWTCRGCHRNNEARLDVCQHCRSRAPTGNTNQRKKFTINPYQRFVQRGSNKNGIGGVGSHRNGLSLPNSTRGQGHDASRVGNMDRGLNAGASDQRYQVRSGGASRTHASCPAPPPRRRTPPRLVPIDPEAAKTWIYPVNYPVRKYQQQIVTAALFGNTLVALPTGLGKTLIAAVVMYNFYRWFPEGKVVFLAPTKPLVAQQISACYDIMGVPEKDTAELQGSVAPEKRRELWRERRVFFCTPQSMVNDIKQKRCNPGKFVCVVVDEAHRGTGNYAYVNVVREVAAVTPYFRVLALSATPGSDTKAIQQVLENLRISHIECRSEDDPEVARHTHARQIEVVRCKLGDHMDAIRQNLVAVLKPLVSRMADKRVLFTRDPMALKAWGVLEALKAFRRTAHDRGMAHMAGEVETEMAILTKVVQAKEVLLTHGAAGCFNKLANMEDEVRQRGFRSNAERGVMRHEAWGDLMKLLRQTAENTAGLSTKHPKLIKLKEVLREHFGRHQAAGKSTRAIVFTQWRDSVEEITDFLADEHLLRVKAFIGQGNGSGGKARTAAEAAKMNAAFRRGGVGVRGVGHEDGGVGSDGEDPLASKPRLKGQTQKEQKAVVKAFFAGEFNCLVATCIGEEGLDIGEVDLIVSFDALSSPVRMVQRMGRTGRKRAGKVVVLVTEGAEESKLRNSNSKSKSITKTLQTRKDKFDMYQGDDPMVPPGPRPRMVEQEMVIDEYHLSQVGGHQRKNSRKGGGGGGSGGASVPKDSWRLTEEQKATLAEAYSHEPGAGRYVPDAASGWKRQKKRWAAGTVARSARSRLLCEIKDFVEHQEWELLYDPGDMQLILATSRGEDENASLGSEERGRGINGTASKYGGNARAGSSGGSSKKLPPATSSDSDSDEDFQAHPSRENAKRRGNPRRCDQGSDGRDEVGNGDGDGVAAQKDKGVRGKVFRDVRREDEVCEGDRGKGARDANGGTGGVSVDGTMAPRDESGCKRVRGSIAVASLTASTAAEQGSGRNSPTTARKVILGTKKSAAVVAEGVVGDQGGRHTGSSEEGVKKGGGTMGRARPQTGRRDGIDNGRDGNGENEEKAQSDPEFRSSDPCKRRVAQGGKQAQSSAVGRWRCDCGCLVKAGRSSCPLCGKAVAERAGDAGALSSLSPSASKSPTSVSVPPLSSSLEPGLDSGRRRCSLPSSKVCAAIEASTSSLKAFDSRSDGLGLGNDGGHSSAGDGSQKIGNAKDGGYGGVVAGNDTGASASSRIQAGRWHCGCGCLMKAGGKRCVMCGQPKPLNNGEAVDLSGGSESVTPHRAEAGKWQCGCGCLMKEGGKRCVICGQPKPLNNGEAVDLSGGSESVIPRRAVAGGTVGGSSCGSGGGDRSPETPAGVGLWKCSGCDNEYVPTRLKCRSCGTPKPTAVASATEARATSDDRTTPARSCSRRDKDRSDNPGNDETCSTMSVSSPELHQQQGQIRAEGIDDPEVEVFAGGGWLPSVHSRVRDLAAGRDRADRDRASSPAMSRSREDASSVGNLRITEDCAVSPVVGNNSSSSSGGKSHSHPASETPPARDGDLKGSRSPRSGTSNQSQDDGLGDLFPSLHRFEAGESAPGASYTDLRRAVGRESYLPSSSGDASVEMAEIFDALPSPLVGPPPSLRVSPAPPAELFAREASLRAGSAGRSAAAKGPIGGLGLPSSRLSVGSWSHKALFPMSKKESAPSRARVGCEASLLNGGAVEPCREVSHSGSAASFDSGSRDFGGGDPAKRSDVEVIVGASHRGGSETESPSLEGVQAALSERSVPAVAGVAMSPSKVAYCAHGNAQACGHDSAPETATEDVELESNDDEEELVFEKVPQDSDRRSDGRSVCVEAGRTREGATERGKTPAAVAEDEPGRLGKNARLNDCCNDNDYDDDDLACGVCGSAVSGEEDPIILCEGPQRCRTAVHADCYGVAEIPEGPWLCDSCSERRGKDKAEGKGEGCDSGLLECHRCALCRHKGGALKLSRCGTWVHVVCVWWTPELSTEPDTVRPRSLSALDPGRAELTCSGCHQQGGAVVPCAEPLCVEACHPFCAMRAGQVLEEENGVFKLFCKLHSRQQKRQKREEKERPKPAVRKEGGTHGSTRGTPTSFSTAPSSATRGEADEGEEYGGEFLAGMEMLSQLPILPRRRHQPKETGGHVAVLRTNRTLLDLEDDDERDKKGDVDSSLQRATSTGSARERERAGRESITSGRGTPRKVFDMAPPQQLPRPSPAKGFDEKIASRTAGLANITASSNNGRSNKRSSLSLPCSSSRQLRGGGGVCSPSGGGGEAGLMTLSQAVSPVEGEERRGGKRRRRLKKCNSPESETKRRDSKSDKRRPDEDASSASKSTERSLKRQRNSNGDGDDKSKEKRAECHYDKASYRRYIDHEAEVDEDLSDDDEDEVLDDYDSEDSFVNDGPLSYETSCSSPDGNTPLRSQESPGDDASDDGGAWKGAKRRRGGAKIGRDRDEKSMYLQLLAQTQSPPANPYLRRRGDSSGSAGRRRRGGINIRRGRGGGSSGRFAFINAVMAHARDGGDPLEIEEACRSDGFTQDGYRSAGSPKTSPSQSLVSETPAKEWSPCDVMSSGGCDSIEAVGARQVSGRPGRDAQPMYSQALRQAHPGSPSPQQEKTRNVAEEPCATGAGKENVPCVAAAALSESTGADQDPRSITDGCCDSAGDDRIAKGHPDGVKGGFVTDVAGGRKAVAPGSGSGSSSTALSSTIPLRGRTANACLGADPAGPMSAPSSNGNGVSREVGLGTKETGTAGGGVCKGVSGGSNKSSVSTSLTDQQRKKMLENREKALARLKQRQQVAAAREGGVSLPVADAIEAKPAAPASGKAPKMASADRDDSARLPPTLQRPGLEARQSWTQRERFRMDMDMESEEDSDVENGDSNASAPPPLSSSSSAPAAVGQCAIQVQVGAKTSMISCGGVGTKAVTHAQRSGSSSATLRSMTSGTAPAVAPPVAASITTLPLSAPRASALESLAVELRSREGFSVHASPLGGGSRDVDLAVGSQCAVCVRSRRQFIAQMQVSVGASAVGGRVSTAAGAAGDGFPRPPLLTLLEAGLQRYTRVVLIKEGLEGEGHGKSRGVSDGIDQQKEEEAVGKVEALRGASVVLSSGWRETADKVVALVEREAAAGAGLPVEVTGPSLTTAQEKFLAFLLRAPTLSYPGGLYLLQAFRGRSGKEMIASSAKEFQSAVPGMTARQAAVLKRFLASGGAVSRPIATEASAVREGPAAERYGGLRASQRGRP